MKFDSKLIHPQTALPQLSKKEMKIQSAKEEADLREVEEQLLHETDANYQPKSAEEWRRKIVSDPHNSEVQKKFQKMKFENLVSCLVVDQIFIFSSLFNGGRTSAISS